MPASAIRPQRVVQLTARTLACPTAPFQEGAVIDWVREFANAHPALVLDEDPHFNLWIRRRGVRASARPLVLTAHMDHPGFRAVASRPVRGSCEHRVEAVFLGGVAPEFFPGARVRFFGDEREVRARVIRRRETRGAGDPHVELRAAGPVPRGAFGMWDLPAFRRQGQRLVSRAVDDLAGVAAILSLFDKVDRIDRRQRVDVRALFTRAEEVGFVGAIAAARGRRLPRKSRVVVIEASKALVDARQGDGPILRVGDRASIFDDTLSRWLARVGQGLAAARGSRFRFQRKLMDGGTCEATAFARYGLRSAGLCLPLGNYHNMSERGRIAAENIHAADLVGLVRFFEGMVRDDARRRAADRDPLRRRLDGLLAGRRADLARDPFARRS